MALIRRTNQLPIQETPSITSVPPVSSPGLVPNTATQSLAGLTRNSVTTPEGITLPISTYTEGGTVYVRETGQPFESLTGFGSIAGGRLATYINSGLVRSTTGRYLTEQGLKTKSVLPGDFVGGSWSGEQMKQILNNPLYTLMFFGGSLTDEYYLQGVGNKKAGPLAGQITQGHLDTYLRNQGFQAERERKGTAAKVKVIRDRMEKKYPGSTTVNPGQYGRRDLSKVYPDNSKKMPIGYKGYSGSPLAGGYSKNYSTAAGYTGNTSKRYSI